MKSGIVKGNLYVIISVIISVMFLLSLKVKFNEELVVSEQKQKRAIEVKVKNQGQHSSEKAVMQSQVTVVLPPPPPRRLRRVFFLVALSALYSSL